jgi:hypothetical protein
MAGLVPAIRLGTSGGRDGRDKPGHDGERMAPRVVIIEVWYCLLEMERLAPVTFGFGVLVSLPEQ